MPLLTAHVLNGKRMGVDVPVNSIIDEPFKVEEVPSLGYADISSVYNWWNYNKGLNKDYLYVRDRIKNIIIEKGIQECLATISTPPVSPSDGDMYCIDSDEPSTGAWEGYEGWCATWSTAESKWVFEPSEWIGYRVLDTEEQTIAAQLKIGSQIDHFVDYGVPTIVDYGYDYHKNSRLTREDRMLRAVVEVYNIIPFHVAEALGDITASPLGDMYFRYMEFGVKGTVEDFNKDFNSSPTPGICDWLYSRAPFNYQEPFISAGYPSGLTLKTWVPIDGQTINQFADKCYDILVNGDSIS